MFIIRELFNENQKTFISNNYENTSYKEIAIKLGTNYSATQIAGWIHNNGKKKSNRSIFSSNDKKYMEQNYKKYSYKYIANKLGFSERQIRHYAEHYLENKSRKFNDNYFEKIDTPDKAYWLGYIYADGCVICNSENRSYEFCMRLQKSDKQVLIDLNNELGGVHEIKENHFERVILNNKNVTVSDLVSLRVYSKKLVEDLIDKNIVCNKTYMSEFPVLKQYFIDFLRGYIDGDGCIYVNKNKKYYPTVHITSYNKKALEYISDRVSHDYSIKSHVYSETPRKHRIYFNGKEAYRLMELLYYNENVQKLDRKYNKFKLLQSKCSLG